MANRKPNILFFHVDNLGMGELGCYGGGILRGADTKRMDNFAKEGMKLTHYVVEPQCTPTRSALMTGRYPIRSGNHTIALGGNSGGIVSWEKTIAELLEDKGYKSACYGKWHIGAEDGRWPIDHGFDEWYGPLRTYDECMWLEDPHYVAERDGFSYMHEGRKGEGCWPLKDQQLTMDMKKSCDLEYLNRSKAFMDKQVADDQPFFVYFNHSLMHFPMIPRDEFVGKSTNGDWGDCLLMLDNDFGVLLDHLDTLGVAENTIVVMCGDNGAEDHLAGRGTGGFFDGSYFSSAEGGIRTPLLIRWPGHIQPGIESNEMIHVTDMFTTLAKFAQCDVPQDRIIDGIDQSAFFLNQQENSNREACMVWLNDELHAVKWKDFKINFKRQQHFHDPELPLGFARITHLQEDPKEREAVNQRYVRWWVMQHAHRVVREFESSVKQEALIPPGSALDFIPDSHIDAK
ncbi:arylsulfatase [Martelella alba]|uniref:Arylsulfatase n=1 Tax=Martelella alba TaxID=2590451 RepID=A0ABY2SPM7_9HYPH|nr:arylsulfatase [Martelella alba]TKI07203.1 arylsulfatase [Martelella alba]